MVGVDMRPPQDSSIVRFEQMDLGREASCLRLIELLRSTGAQSVVHLAFVLDPQQTGILDVERMWQINVAGTARVMEAISVVNRTGGNIQQFIYPSSVAAYGPETNGPVKEDSPLRAHTRCRMPSINARAMRSCVIARRAWAIAASTFCGRTSSLAPRVQNYMVGALRGTRPARASAPLACAIKASACR